MYNVLIVDDEVLIRKRIQYGFAWDEMGFVVTGEAESGMSALTLLEQQAFDVAIIDIAMPGMDGIELVQRIRERKLNLEIIFLTGHSEFEYARVALREGVFAYVLKPLNEAEFINTLTELQRKMDRERKQEQNYQNLQFILENQRMLELLYSAGKRHYPLKQPFAKWCDWRFVIVRITNLYEKTEAYLEVCQKIKQYIGVWETENVCVYFDIQGNDFYVLADDPRMKEREACAVFCNEFRSAISVEIEQEVELGISEKIPDITGLHTAYRQALRAVNNNLISGERVTLFETIQKTTEHKYILPIDYIRELRLSIETKDQTLADQILMNIFKEMKNIGVDYQEILRIGEQIISILLEITAKQKLDIQMVMGDYYTVEAAYSYMKEYDEIARWFQSITANIIKIQSENQPSKPKNEVAIQAKSYVKEHYMEQELTVKTLALKLFVTDTYLSALFKKSMGISLVQYITQCRLEKARELITAGETEVNKVARMVGYSDEYYFSRCFKKYFGISPFHEKKKHLHENE